jgi:DNA polymerase I-like protein with 3'-5' exonuclease and polymerase domains
MDAGHLKVLAKEYPSIPFYKLTLEYHKLSKTLGTYIYDPDADGLIHTTYKNTPSTPRFSSVNKNLQNVGKREDNIWATEGS